MKREFIVYYDLADAVCFYGEAVNGKAQILPKWQTLLRNR